MPQYIKKKPMKPKKSISQSFSGNHCIHEG